MSQLADKDIKIITSIFICSKVEQTHERNEKAPKYNISRDRKDICLKFKNYALDGIGGCLSTAKEKIA